jgi:uncharacterized damage-inducible protein DinB
MQGGIDMANDSAAVESPAQASEQLGSPRQVGLNRLNFARFATSAILADIPEEQWCFQPFPGANHAMWLVGHLAVIDDLFLSRLAGRPSSYPEGWAQLFASGTKPLPDPGAYPSPDLVRQFFAQHRQELVSWFASRGEAELAAPPPDELRKFGQSVGELMASIAWHEGWHGGQLAVVRKTLGLGPKFG